MKLCFIKSIVRTTIGMFLLLVGFSLQSFTSVTGIQIEKRHYRNGYYIHICHGVKTNPCAVASADQVTEKVEPPVAGKGDAEKQIPIPEQVEPKYPIEQVVSAPEVVVETTTVVTAVPIVTNTVHASGVNILPTSQTTVVAQDITPATGKKIQTPGRNAPPVAIAPK